MGRHGVLLQSLLKKDSRFQTVTKSPAASLTSTTDSVVLWLPETSLILNSGDFGYFASELKIYGYGGSEASLKSSVDATEVYSPGGR